MNSQNEEERYVLEHVGDHVGRFLDIGAYDGITFSNTFSLISRGWGGVAVEASPVNFVSLMSTLKTCPQIDLLCAAITPTDEKIINFWDSHGDAISTSDTAHMKKWSKRTDRSGGGSGGVDWQMISVPSITVGSLLAHYGRNFSLINLDVEGYTWKLFNEFPWEELKLCTCVIVEHDNNSKQIINRLKPLGYREIYANGENIILTRNVT